MLVSCQAYKSVSSKYNILYNGELFLDEGISQLKESYNENFWEIIPVLTENNITNTLPDYCLLYTSPSPRDPKTSRMPSSA